MNIRKRNRLPDYDYSQPGAYFITVCVKDHKCLLGKIVGVDDHIDPSTANVGVDDHIDPSTANVGVDDHIDPHNANVGVDDYIDPHNALTNIGKVVEKYTRLIPGIAEYMVMPNHVHMILRISSKTPGDGPMWSSAPTDARVENLIRTWKTLITKELGESIWQRSYYDHIIRSEEEYVRIAEYILGNPGKWSEDKYYSIM